MSLKLGVRFVYTFEPIATCFKMLWKYHFPSLSLQADTTQALLHLASEAAPLLMQRTAGYALMSFARLSSQAYQLYYRDMNRWEKTKLGLEVFSTISPLLMVVSTLAPGYFIGAIVIRIGMELYENAGELRNYQKLSKSEICDRILPLISHAFYLIALMRACSYPIRLSSIVFQGMVACYQTSKLVQKNKAAGLIWALIGTLRFYQGYRYYQFKAESKLQFVYKQRHAEKQKGVRNPALTENGQKQAKLAGPILEKYLLEKTGQTQWVYVSSTYKRSIQTAQGMLEGLKRPEQSFFIDGRLRERIRGESQNYVYSRQEAAIDDLRDEIADSDRGIISIDHSTAGKCYARQVEQRDPVLLEKHLKPTEGFLYRRENGKITLLDRFFPISTQTATSTS